MIRICGLCFSRWSRSSLSERSCSTAVGTIRVPASANGSMRTLNASTAARTPRQPARKPDAKRRWLASAAASRTVGSGCAAESWSAVEKLDTWPRRLAGVLGEVGLRDRQRLPEAQLLVLAEVVDGADRSTDVIRSRRERLAGGE